MSRNHSGIMIRASTILRYLHRSDYISVRDLSKSLDVSAATIRKDLDRLEQQGLLRRTHGGAIPIENFLYEPFRANPSFADNEMQCVEEKRQIAQRAVTLIGDNEVVAFSGGTTATQIARAIHYRHNLTVVTNAINIAMELSNRNGVTVYVPGGYLKGGMFALCGMSGVNAVTDLMIDKAFIGVSGIHPEQGLTTFGIEQAEFLRALVRQAKQRIVVTDHTKIGHIHKAFLCHTNEIDMIITDAQADQNVIEKFQSVGVEVLLAD
jgi:DeoR family transcriptional regulator, aga operon transcriptional repressor